MQPTFKPVTKAITVAPTIKSNKKQQRQPNTAAV